MATKTVQETLLWAPRTGLLVRTVCGARLLAHTRLSTSDQPASPSVPRVRCLTATGPPTVPSRQSTIGTKLDLLPFSTLARLVLLTGRAFGRPADHRKAPMRGSRGAPPGSPQRIWIASARRNQRERTWMLVLLSSPPRQIEDRLPCLGDAPIPHVYRC